MHYAGGVWLGAGLFPQSRQDGTTLSTARHLDPGPGLAVAGRAEQSCGAHSLCTPNTPELQPSPPPAGGCPLTLTEKGVPDAQHCGEGQGAGEEAQEPLGQVEQGPDAHLLQVFVHTWEQPPQQGHEHLSIQLHSLLRPRPSAPPLPKPSRLCPPQSPGLHPPTHAAPPLCPLAPSQTYHVGPVVAWQVKLTNLHQAPEGLLGVGHRP